MLNVCPGELRADMQRWYGLDIDEIGHSIRVRRAADLAANIPEDGAVWPALDPRMRWGTTKQLLANISDATSFTAWTKTKDAQRGHATWKGALQRPGMDRRRSRQPDVQAISPEQLDRMLRLPRIPAPKQN